MTSNTKIEWTDASWSPVVGCTKIAAGCKNCYAERMAIRLNGIFAAKGDDDNWAAMSNILKFDYSPQTGYEFGKAVGWNGQVELFYSRLDKPLHWRKPRMIFVCSMSDLFHEKVPFGFIDKVMDIINICRQHTFQILTKRPERTLEYIKTIGDFRWHSNLWLGVSISTQEDADKNIPILLQIPAAVRFVSIEPMLGPVKHAWDNRNGPDLGHMSFIDWVIVGGESGPKRRPCKLEWVQNIVNQCKQAGVPVFVKQLSINGKVSHNPKEWPEDLRVREYPKGR